MMDTIINIGLPVVTAGIGGIFSWFTAKRKYKVETDSTEINNMKETLEFYTILSNDNKEKLDTYIDENEKLRADNKELKEQNTKLIEQNNQLLDKITDLEKKIEELSKKLNAISKPKSKKNEAASKKNS